MLVARAPLNIRHHYELEDDLTTFLSLKWRLRPLTEGGVVAEADVENTIQILESMVV